MMKEKRRGIALWAACALWMAFIFAMSATPGDISGAQSGRLARLLAACLTPFFEMDAGAINTLDFFVRKCAHMTEYAVLFLLYRAALGDSGARSRGVKALLLVIGYAATDEFHQVFVPGRGPAVMDVAIDTCGALIGWSAAAMIGWIKARIKSGAKE